MAQVTPFGLAEVYIVNVAPVPTVVFPGTIETKASASLGLLHPPVNMSPSESIATATAMRRPLSETLVLPISVSTVCISKILAGTYHLSSKANSTCRGSSADLYAPKLASPRVTSGLLKFRWLTMLNASTRKRTSVLSVIWKILNKVTLLMIEPGPRMLPTGALPNMPLKLLPVAPGAQLVWEGSRLGTMNEHVVKKGPFGRFPELAGLIGCGPLNRCRGTAGFISGRVVIPWFAVERPAEYESPDRKATTEENSQPPKVFFVQPVCVNQGRW